MPEVREAQADMAREAGIEGFMYWHYWFGNGKQILERPFLMKFYRQENLISHFVWDGLIIVGRVGHGIVMPKKHKNLDLMIQEYPVMRIL